MKTNADHSSASDEQLVKAAKDGEMAAFEELVARHRDKIYARAFSMMRNEDEALDLSQEAWVKGWQRLKQFQGDSKFGTWMTRIVINLCAWTNCGGASGSGRSPLRRWTKSRAGSKGKCRW